MTDVPDLTPYSFDTLLSRIAHEWDRRHRVFDLPTARFWSPHPETDLSMKFLGRPAATPVGPAAGPHSQMAQNIVLGWLAGARVFELKTVQVIDNLEISRPCIDMETIGFNIEWSQELKVHESLEEYVKAWMAIAILSKWEPIRELVGPDPGPHVFDMSVGYDLDGIKTDKVAGFIDSLRDGTDEIERLRPLIPEAFSEFRDLDFPSCVSDTVTVSTFHGCPPDEIEAIAKHLMTRHELDVIVKLNPTLLGFGDVVEILQQTLGYEHIRLNRHVFPDDLSFDRGLELIGDLREFARREGRRFGVKLTNTLVVDNDKAWMPDDPMYLSGPPLHVLATTLLDELLSAMPNVFDVAGHGGDVQVSFSAGVTRENLSKTVGMGVAPATLSSDLLKPGGYGRLDPMLRQLTGDMRSAGVRNLADWHHHNWLEARSQGYRGPVEAHMRAILDGPELELYSYSGNRKTPRKVDHELQMWGCVACNFCVTVCPNDAFFNISTPEGSGLDGRQQYMVLAELCNECGNCMTFCPEDGDPAQVKPKLFLTQERFDMAQGQGFLITADNGGLSVTAKPESESEAERLHSVISNQEGIPINVLGG